jgi:hypothetical protein
MRATKAGGAALRAGAWVAVLACLVLLLPAAHGDDVAVQGRQVVDKWQNTVVTVRLVIKMTMSMGDSGQEEGEHKADINGTVVDPSGLTVVSLSEVDPAEMYKRMMGGEGPDEPGFNVESKLSDVKLRFADGTEVPAKVVLRDKDLDLAFVGPAEKLPKPVPAVDLAQSGAPQLLDPVASLNRLGDSGDWAIAPRIDRVQAILTKPRTVYVPQDIDETGTPVFMLDGKIVGITLVRLPAPGAPSTEMSDYGGLAIILPAADVLEVAKQALAAG